MESVDQTVLLGNQKTWSGDLLKLTLALGLLFFTFLGVRPLANPDEGRYAEIPREMLQTGNYVTPRLDGVKYFEKPPLVYWLTAGALEVFGMSEWSVRFWMAAFAVAGGLLVYAAGRAWYGRAVGIWAAVVLSTSLLFYALSRVALIDLIMAVLIAAALFSFLEALRAPPGNRRRWLFWAFYAAMGLATLAKGLVGFLLPGAVAFVWVLGLNRWRQLRPCYPFSGTAWVLGIALPWHVMVARANPDFLYFYFVHEHFMRYATQVHDRYQPWWFFIPIVLAGFFPWTVFLAQALRRNFVALQRDQPARAETWFLVIWVIVISIFFSTSQSKLIPYILPIFPALAVLLGRYLAEAWDLGGAHGFKLGLWAYAAIGVALAVAILIVKVPAENLTPGLSRWRGGLAAIVGGGGITVAVCMSVKAARLGMVALVVSTVAFLGAINFVGAEVDQRSTKSLAIALRQQVKAEDGIYALGEYFQDFPFYLGRLVEVVDYEGELAFGIHAEPTRTAHHFISPAEFVERWREKGKFAYAIVKRTDLSHWLKEPGLGFSIVAETPQVLIVVNHPPAGT